MCVYIHTHTYTHTHTHYFVNKGPYSQSYGFSSSHIQIWELDHKEVWAPKNWDFQTVVLENTLKIPLDFKEIKPVIPTGNQPWVFIGRTNAQTLILWQSILWCEEPTQKRPWFWEILKAGGGGDNREWDSWMASLTQHEFEQTLGESEGQGSLACCSPWGHEESDTT